MMLQDRHRVSVAVTGALALGGFTLGSAGSARVASAQATEGSTTGVAIGVLATRDHRVTLTATLDGVRYGVDTREGEPLARDLALAQLAERFPALFERVRSGLAAIAGDVADRATRDGDFVWAGR